MTAQLESPVVTVSLVTFNGLRWLEGCLRSLSAQTAADYELLVVDNASTDGTRELLRVEASRDERIVVCESEQNLGYAVAHNRNIDVARGEYILLLNQDVELEDSFIEASLAALRHQLDVAGVQGRLLTLSLAGERTDTIDSTGLQMHRDRRVVSRRQAEREDERDLVAGPVWGVDGPAPVFRAAALRSVREPRTGGGQEVLDEDFFMYKEDVDLAWRLRRAGWSAWYEPRAVAWHARGAGAHPARSMLDIARSNWTIPLWIKRISWRNQRLMQLKNETAASIAHDLPWILRREILSLAFMVAMDQRRLTAIGDLVRLAPSALRKRRMMSLRAPIDSAR